MSREKPTFRQKKLQLAFGVLILLTTGIGITGILQIESFSQKVERLSRRNLKLEKAVLEMRVNNTVYAMGVRNYVSWRISRYLGAAPTASNTDIILGAAGKFQQQLKIYEEAAYLPEQTEWARQVESYFAEFNSLGRQLIDLSNLADAKKAEGAINNVLMSFDSHYYRVDEFLNNTMGKANLDEIEMHIAKSESDKKRAIAFLAFMLASAVSVGILIALVVYRRLSAERRHREELFSQMMNIEESERRNLSNAVHDQMGQDLSALKINLGLLEQNLGAARPAAELKTRIDESRKIVNSLLDKSHNIAFLLRPPDLDEVGLTESLEALILEYKHLTSVNFNYQKPGAGLNLAPQYSLLLYRISQELLTNMVKHAQAKNVNISLNKNNNCIEFVYSDDGEGFDYSQVEKQPRRRKEDKLRLGLASLKERVKLLDGQMSIDAAPGKGTRIIVRLPLS